MNLDELRLEIDRIDRELVDLFSRRMAVSAEIAAYKKEHLLPVLDAERERSKRSSLAALAEPEMAEYVDALYTRLFELSRSYQETLLSSDSDAV